MLGLKACGPPGGPKDEKGMVVCGGTGGVGLKVETSDPATGTDEEKGVCEGGLEPGASCPTTGPEDEKGVMV